MAQGLGNLKQVRVVMAGALTVARRKLHAFVSPSVRTVARDAVFGWADLASKLKLWEWTRLSSTPDGGQPFPIRYVGRASHHAAVFHLLGATQTPSPGTCAPVSERTVRVGDLPAPGALRIPLALRAVVPLQGSMDAILRHYDADLRRWLVKHRPRFEAQRVIDETEIDRINEEMLKPYAVARKGDSANHVATEVVRGMARGPGRLDVVYHDGEAVSCHLGFPLSFRNRKYWSAMRFGFPAAVFNDRKRLGDVNSINTFVAMEWALNNGYDFYDFGTSPAHPDDGLLQWKRRRGGELTALVQRGSFYLSLPEAGASTFLWKTPLFSLGRGDRISLHLGLPKQASQAEVAKRYDKMGFAGLCEVVVHADEAPTDATLQTLRSLHEGLEAPPMLRVQLAA